MDAVDIVVSLVGLAYVLYTGFTLYRELRTETRDDLVSEHEGITWWDAERRCWRDL